MTGYPGVLLPPNVLQRLRARLANERGFSLIELMVVILIIGILATIALPSFLGQRDKAYDAVAKAQLTNASSAASFYLADEGTFAALVIADLYGIEPSLQSDPTVTLDSSAPPTATTYTVQVTSQSDKTFKLAYNDGVVTRTCTPSCAW